MEAQMNKRGGNRVNYAREEIDEYLFDMREGPYKEGHMYLGFVPDQFRTAFNRKAREDCEHVLMMELGRAAAHGKKVDPLC